MMMTRHAAWFTAALALGSGCTPSSDLDEHARGSLASAPVEGAAATSSSPEPEGPGATPSLDPGASLGEASPGEGLAPPTLDPSASAAPNDAGALGTLGPSSPARDAAAEPSVPLDPGVVEPGQPPTVAEAPPLPDDLRDAPVAGEIVFSDEAVWEVDGVFEPTFEIHTPTASYWVVKPLGTIVSIEDREPEFAQWISFSSGFRPLRGVPSFAEPPATRVTTVRDDASQTPTHLRLTVVSDDGLWQWVWDFYVTHVTFTINRAPGPIGFAYQGVPGGSLGAEDQLVSSAGVAQGARSSFNEDLAGPVEWAYLADTTLGRSLFGIQHRDDELPERYQVRDNDTALFRFGNGAIDTLPLRFSLGLIPSVSHATVSERVDFITRSIP
jgi:hypothetical protein